MIDLHTHSFLSDGVLVPSELVRRAQVAGYKAIAITDHADASNIDMVIESLCKVSQVLNKYWDITVIPGVELTHIPLETFKDMVSYAREKGARVVVAHGESPVEPVLPGTNRAAIEAGVDILAHPGNISPEDAKLAAEKGVYLEITCRKGHSATNKHVFDTAMEAGCGMVVNTDGHAPEDLMTPEKVNSLLSDLTSDKEVCKAILANSEKLVDKLKV